MSEGYIQTSDGVDLYYRKLGDSGPNIIIPNALYLFEDFKYLASEYTLVFYDLRNRGRSSKVTDSSKLSGGILNDVADLEAVRKHFDLQKTHLIGHSYLGLMVFLYARQNPEHIDRVVQIGPMQYDLTTTYAERYTANDSIPIPSPEELEELTKLEESGYNLANPEGYTRRWWEIIRKIYVTDPDDAAKIVPDIDRFPNEWATNQMKHLTENIMPSIQRLEIDENQLQSCSIPILVIHGTRDRAVPYGAGRDWAFNLPNARLLTVKNGGHMPWIESPGDVEQAIETFLSGSWPEKSEQVLEPDFEK